MQISDIKRISTLTNVMRAGLNEVPDEHVRLKTNDVVLYKHAGALDKRASIHFKWLCAINKGNVT